MLIAATVIVTNPLHAHQMPPLVQEKENPLVHARVWQAYSQSDSQAVVWIYFTDKQIYSAKEYQSGCIQIRNQLAERVKWRRRKVMGQHVVNFHDLPVPREYIEKIAQLGAKLRTTSRWLNAISVSLPFSSIGEVSALPFVSRITLVNKSILRPIDEQVRLKKPVFVEPHALNYGSSFDQLQQINVPAVHDLGYSGAGVIVGMLDTGYNRHHEALQHLHLIAEWDFINNDDNTRNEPGDDFNQHNHGTWTLSALAGMSSGNLYGPAYEASFLLAKTEDITSETPIEEDYWVAGIEWQELNGVDVVSSSLGYLDWYSYSDMDGNTAVTTVAADLAAQRGVVVCIAAGNWRNDGWFYISAPADGDSVIACGAVDANRLIASFSSSGPTFDGRIKPEVVARGISTVCASSIDSTGYVTKSGTSLSTPLVGGSAALILQAHPKWTPMMVREALMMTADRANNPDNLYGWGLIDVLAAIQYRPRGDVNGDDEMNILDIVLARNIMLGDYLPSDQEAYAADVNVDEVIDGFDIDEIVTRIIGK